ncbi:MAG TPA: hypothetical protein VEZ72_17270, partial [Paenibacillus sp.]|nr:hypothetical protein [Paenibacillus sp.]
NLLRDVTVSSSVAGPHLIGNGTIGGVVGAKTGQGANAYDIERVRIEGVRFAAQPNSPSATVGGIAGALTDVALHDATFRSTIALTADEVVAGGIAGVATDSILYKTDVVTDIAASAKSGTSAVGGVAGIVRATDRDARFDFGQLIPFYPGVYETKVHSHEIKASGVDHGGDLFLGGIAGRLENASIYHAEASSALKALGGKTVGVGGIAGFSDGIVVRSTALSPIDASDSRVYHVGGVAGLVAGGEMHYTYTEGTQIVVGVAVTKPGLTPATHVGGFVGKADHATFADSYADRDVTIVDANQDNTIYAGGFAGILGDDSGASGAVRRSYATGDVSLTGVTGSIAGGFAGSVDRTLVEEAYATGNVANTGFDTRSGGFAGEAERGAVIKRAYTASAKVVTTGVNHATRSYSGGFVGFNDGTLTDVFAKVPTLTTTVVGANAYKGGIVGYNFRDGKITSSSYHPAGAAWGYSYKTDAVQATAADASASYASFAGWVSDPDSSLFSAYGAAGVDVRTPLQLVATVKLHNADTGLAYFRLFDRSAVARPTLSAVTLGADIDMSGYAWIPFDVWTGTFDGKGFTVSGLENALAPAVPANGFVAENRGVLSNVELIGTFAGGANVGAAAGVNKNGAVVRNVSAKADASGVGNVGGLVGANEGTIEKSFSRGTAIGNDAGAVIAAGGIAGANRSTGAIVESFSFVDVSVVASDAAAGGIVGANDGTFSLTNSLVTNIELVNAADRSNYTLGGIAGALTADATIGAKEAPIEVDSLVADAKAANASLGGAVGANASPRLYVAVTDGTFAASSAQARVGGIAGTHTALVTELAGATPDVIVADSAFHASATGAMVGGLYGDVTGSVQRGLAENATIAATAASAKVGGIAGRNVGALRDSEARNVVVTASAADVEAGGAVGRSETLGDARASITDVTTNASFDQIITATAAATNAKVGGIVG